MSLHLVTVSLHMALSSVFRVPKSTCWPVDLWCASPCSMLQEHPPADVGTDEGERVPMQVKTFNLQESKVIRDLNPADINCLISVSGMVTRTSAVIPDLTCACLRNMLQLSLCLLQACCMLHDKRVVRLFSWLAAYGISRHSLHRCVTCLEACTRHAILLVWCAGWRCLDASRAAQRSWWRRRAGGWRSRSAATSATRAGP